MTIAIDGTASSSSNSISLSTSNAGDLVLVAIEAIGSGTVTGLSGASLGWQLRYAGSVNLSGTTYRLYLYYALASAALSSALISIATSGTVSLNSVAFGISGATEFDSNSSLPAVASYSQKTRDTTPSVSGVSTTTPNACLLSFVARPSTGNNPGSGYTNIVAGTPDNQYKVVSSAQSGITVSFGSGDIDNAWIMLVDAVVASQPATGTVVGKTTVSGAGFAPIKAAGTIVAGATVAGAGVAARQAAGTVAGRAGVEGVAVPSGYATGTIAGKTTVAGASAAIKAAAGVVLGKTVVRGTPTASSVGTVLGKTRVAGAGVTAARGAGTIAGHAIVAGASAATKKSAGTISAHATVAGAGVAAAPGAGTISGKATVAGAGAYFTKPLFNWFLTVISQYANSTTLLAVLESFNAAEDPTSLFDLFYDFMWNVDTAQGYGLDVWGRIVGVNRVLQIPSGGKYFGFDEATTVSADPFNQSPFYGGETTTQNFALSDSGFRTLILAKAAANICDGSIPAINSILMMLFGSSGNCYVTDGGDMTMTYTFTFALSPVQAAIVQNSGVLPKPAGVAVSIVQP